MPGKRSARQLWSDHIRSGGQTTAKAAVPTLARPFSGTVLGADPSLRGTGLAVMAFKAAGEPRLLTSQTVKVPSRVSSAEALVCIADAVERLLDAHPIDVTAIEQTIFVQNWQTALVLGGARAAVMLPVARRGIPLTEYAPKRIKQAVTGNGQASKAQVTGMMRQLLRLMVELPPDEADAAATAYCHAMTWRPEA